MRLVRLEVENFRGVRSAKLDFEPGVNVLHGPNELGKSTLAEAVRAALLTKPSSTQADTYLRWDDVVPTRVVLTFEVGGEVWRVTKKFSSHSSALLERQAGAPAGRWHTMAQAGSVEGKLRELLNWGMAAPGSKGALSKKESYLVVALLGRQGEACQILESSLEGDADDSGKVSITKALGALGSDPQVTDIVARLVERTDEVFTPTGRTKQTADSPLFRLQQKVQAAVAELHVLGEKAEESRKIAALVVAAHDEWLRLAAEHRDAEAALRAAQRRHEHDKTRSQLQGEIDECRATLDHASQLRDRLAGLRAGLDAAAAAEQAARAALAAAVVAVDGLLPQVQEASEDVVRAQAALDRTGLEDEASRQQRRIVLTGQTSAVQDRLRQIQAAEAVTTRLAQLEGELAAGLETVAARKADQERALAALDHATWAAELSFLLDLETTALRLQGVSDDEQRRESAAAAALAHAEANLTAAESHRQHRTWLAEPALAAAATEIDRLEAAALHLRIDNLRSRVADFEALDAQRQRHLDAATRKRDEASLLEQEAAARELPTAERVAEWREWEAELGSEVPAGAQGLAAWLTAALVAATAGVVVGTMVFLAGVGSAAAVVAALVAAVLAGALVWQLASTRDRAAGTMGERRRLLQERLTREVRPALGRANIASLSELDGARHALDETKARAGRLRGEAAHDDQEAARLAGQVAPLEGLRHELAGLPQRAQAGVMAGAGPVEPADLRQLLEECGSDRAKVRARQDAARAQLDALQATLSQAADTAVAAARVIREQEQALHGQLVKDAAAAKAQYDEALRRCDSARVAQLRTQIAASALFAKEPIAVESAKAGLDRGRDDLSQASATADGLRRQVDDLRLTVEQHLTTLGEDPPSARSKVEGELADVERQLAALELPSSDGSGVAAKAVAAAERRRDEVNDQLVEAKANVERTTVAVSAAAATLAEASNQVASTDGALNAIDTVGVEARLQGALSHPAFAEPDVPGPDVTSALEGHETATKRLHDCEGRVNAAKGQLRLVGGHAVAERLARQEEIVAFARQEYEEKELTERAALHLLNEVRAAEAEATSNLGRTLAGPVTEMLKQLTGGRYGAIDFATDLTAGGVSAAGASRELECLSVGTKEQIATLVRLAIAAQLQTALVLDDQLVHSDTERLRWFRDRLCASAHDRQHQIVVITCRPGDYLPPEGADATYPVNVVDLSTVVDVSA